MPHRTRSSGALPGENQCASTPAGTWAIRRSSRPSASRAARYLALWTSTPSLRDRAQSRCRRAPGVTSRSEEHTSELQSLAYLVCRLLLEKKKKKVITNKKNEKH